MLMTDLATLSLDCSPTGGLLGSATSLPSPERSLLPSSFDWDFALTFKMEGTAAHAFKEIRAAIRAVWRSSPAHAIVGVEVPFHENTRGAACHLCPIAHRFREREPSPSPAP
jgi:hypothetical protein